MEILLLENMILDYKGELESLLEEGQFILDEEVVDKETFETIRPATEREIDLFYGIRLLELKIKELKRTLN